MPEINTMIRLKLTTRQALEKLKIIPRETYNDVVLRLIGTWKEHHKYKKIPLLPPTVNRKTKEMGFNPLEYEDEDDDF